MPLPLHDPPKDSDSGNVDTEDETCPAVSYSPDEGQLPSSPEKSSVGLMPLRYEQQSASDPKSAGRSAAAPQEDESLVDGEVFLSSIHPTKFALVSNILFS